MTLLLPMEILNSRLLSPFLALDECANYAQIVNLVGDIKIETKMIVIYRINSNNKIESLRAFWDYQKMEKQLNEMLSN